MLQKDNKDKPVYSHPFNNLISTPETQNLNFKFDLVSSYETLGFMEEKRKYFITAVQNLMKQSPHPSLLMDFFLQVFRVEHQLYGLRVSELTQFVTHKQLENIIRTATYESREYEIKPNNRIIKAKDIKDGKVDSSLTRKIVNLHIFGIRELDDKDFVVFPKRIPRYIGEMYNRELPMSQGYHNPDLWRSAAHPGGIAPMSTSSFK